MSLTDTLGSLAVATKGHYMTGVSVDIGASFIKPAGKVHDVFTAEAVVNGIGTSPRPLHHKLPHSGHAYPPDRSRGLM